MIFPLPSLRQSPTLLALGVLISSNVVFGQFPGQQSGTSTIPQTTRPQANQTAQPQSGQAPLQVANNIDMQLKPERPSPEMLLLLDEWEKATADIQSLKGTFRRYDYDHVFMTEKRAVGKYWFASPDKARMDFLTDPEVAKLPADPNGGKPTHQAYGKVFTVEAYKNETWICNGKEILEADHDKKQFNRLEIPAQYQGQRITDGPMPFLFGMKSKSVQERYKLVIGPRHDPNQQLHVVAYPLVPGLQREFTKAELFLNPKTYLPQAVRLSDPSGNKENVYVFYEPSSFGLEEKLNDPFKVYLGPPWKLIHDRKADDPNQLPMHEKREVNNSGLLPGFRQTAESNSGLKSQ